MIHNKLFILQTIPAVQVLVSENLLCSLGLEFHLLQVELVIQPLSKWPPWAPPLVGRTRNKFGLPLDQLLQVVLRLLGTTAGLLGNLLLRVVLGLRSLQHDSNLVVLLAQSENFFTFIPSTTGRVNCCTPSFSVFALSRSICLLESFLPRPTNPSWCRLR